MTLSYEDQYSLPLLFHVNSEPWLNQHALEDSAAMMEFKSLGDADSAVSLPEPETSTLMSLISARESCRHFARPPLSLQDLGAVMHAGYGVLGMRQWPVARVFCRPVPSAGGLYPLEMYALCERVSNVPGGLYHVNARRRSLEPLMQDCSIRNILPHLLDQAYVADAAALVFFTAVFPRTLKKYGPRGYRYVLLEAGHGAQNMCLRAAELGLGTLCLGGFKDAPINRLLRVDGKMEAAIYAVALGHMARTDDANQPCYSESQPEK